MMNTKSGPRYRFHLILEGIALIFMINFSAAGQNQFDRLTRVLESKRQALGGNVCMLIFKDNRVVFEKNLGSYTNDTPEMIASCSKWLTAALVATFIDEGKISLLMIQLVSICPSSRGMGKGISLLVSV